MSNIVATSYEIGEGAFACGRRYLKDGKWVRPCDSKGDISEWVQAVKEMSEEIKRLKVIIHKNGIIV